MTHFYDGQARSVSYRVTGRMGLSEMVSLLTHLNNDYQHPWVDSFRYSYDPDSNETYLGLTVTNDRPHDTRQPDHLPGMWEASDLSGGESDVMGGNAAQGESGKAANGGA